MVEKENGNNIGIIKTSRVYMNKQTNEKNIYQIREQTHQQKNNGCEYFYCSNPKMKISSLLRTTCGVQLQTLNWIEVGFWIDLGDSGYVSKCRNFSFVQFSLNVAYRIGLNMFLHGQDDGCHVWSKICLPFSEHLTSPQLWLGPWWSVFGFLFCYDFFVFNIVHVCLSFICYNNGVVFNYFMIHRRK